MTNLGDDARILKYRIAVAACRKGDPLRLAHTVRHLGDAYRQARQDHLAEPCYVEALETYRQHPNEQPLDLANALRGFALLKENQGSIEAAQPLWTEAHDLYASTNVSAGVAESAARLALGALRRGDVAVSREWLARATSASEASRDPETMAYVRQVASTIASDRS